MFYKHRAVQKKCKLYQKAGSRNLQKQWSIQQQRKEIRELAYSSPKPGFRQNYSNTDDCYSNQSFSSNRNISISSYFYCQVIKALFSFLTKWGRMGCMPGQTRLCPQSSLDRRKQSQTDCSRHVLPSASPAIQSIHAGNLLALLMAWLKPAVLMPIHRMQREHGHSLPVGFHRNWRK